MTTKRTPLRWAAAAAVLLLLAAPGRIRAEDGPLWLVVTRPAFAEALRPLAAHRRAQGLSVEIVTTTVADALEALPAPPAYLLLVGDEGREQEAVWRVPAPRRALYRWRLAQRKDFAADALLGDLDGDLLPDVPVGRIPARTKAQVETAVGKILAYERRAPTPDDLRVVAWAGAPGYGGLLDSMATSFLVQTVRSKTPDWAGRYLLSAAPGHPLSGWPPEQPAIFNHELARGAVLGAVIAHASASRVVLLHHEGTSILYGPEETASAFAQGPPVGPLVLLACDCGAFDRDVPCLAESLLFLPGGPVATVAAATESHPLTNYFTGRTMLEALGQGKDRLGDLWVAAQRAGRTARSLLIERALRDAEGSLEEDIDVEQLRRDQVLMYALLGDPATRLRIPLPLEAEIGSVEGGWRWTVTRPEGATALHVSVRRPPAARVRARKAADRDPETARVELAAANATTVFDARPGPGPDGAWEGEIEGPEGGWLRLIATGPGVFRVYVARLEKR